MTAGRGIVHSERTPPNLRKTASSVHGMQLWVALPRAHEEVEPSFQHHAASAIPVTDLPGARIRVIAGAAFGQTSPVKVLSPLFYAEVLLERDAELELPAEHAERAAYIVSGALDVGAEGRMVVFDTGAHARIRAREPSRVLLLGGAPLDGERQIWWNFVSSSKERIERAKADWREGRFPKVPGDETEFIPLPD